MDDLKYLRIKCMEFAVKSKLCTNLGTLFELAKKIEEHILRRGG